MINYVNLRAFHSAPLTLRAIIKASLRAINLITV
nr:MAG TPA: hypothetical protein [Caudoviricetes sp.]